MKRPRWLRKTDIARMEGMDPEDAMNELNRLHDGHKAKAREYRRTNPEKIAAYRSRYNKRHKKRIAAKDKARFQALKLDVERYARRRELERLRDKNRPERARDPIKRNERERRYRQRCKTLNMARNKPLDLRKAIQSLLPGYLPPHARMDVIGAVIADALDRKIEFRKLPEAVKAHVSAYNRQFDYFKTVSIDAPISGTEGLTRADLLDTETMHF